MSDRNLKPHAEAALAMAMWGDEYGAQNGGSMDFWDNLSPRQKQLCASIVDRVLYAYHENGRALLSKLEER